MKISKELAVKIIKEDLASSERAVKKFKKHDCSALAEIYEKKVGWGKEALKLLEKGWNPEDAIQHSRGF